MLLCGYVIILLLLYTRRYLLLFPTYTSGMGLKTNGQGRIKTLGAPCQRVMGALPFPPLPSPSLSDHPLTSLPQSPSPPADKRFGAYWSQKGLLWWQQFFVEFFARKHVIFIIF